MLQSENTHSAFMTPQMGHCSKLLIIYLQAKIWISKIFPWYSNTWNRLLKVVEPPLLEVLTNACWCVQGYRSTICVSHMNKSKQITSYKWHSSYQPQFGILQSYVHLQMENLIYVCCTRAMSFTWSWFTAELGLMLSMPLATSHFYDHAYTVVTLLKPPGFVTT